MSTKIYGCLVVIMRLLDYNGLTTTDDAADPHHMLLIHYVHLAENKTWKPEAQCLGNSPACDRGKFCVDEP